MPEISVIVPCYKTEPSLLIRCVKSVLGQTFSDLELIIVDDGNTAKYRKVYDHVELQDERIRVIKIENGGVSNARNTGVSKARGRYIVFADADDILLENFLMEAYHIAEKHCADLVMGGNIDMKLADTISERLKAKYPVNVYSGERVRDLNRYMLGRRRYFIGKDGISVGQGPWTRLVKKELAESVMFDTSLPIGEDVVWNLELLRKCRTVCVAETAWYGYYYNPDSATRRYRERAVEESEESLNKMRTYLDLNNDAEFYSFCSRTFVDLDRLSRCYIDNNDNPHSRKEIKRKKKYIYTHEPWSILNSRRFFRMCSNKERATLLLFRFRLLFLYYSMR